MLAKYMMKFDIPVKKVNRLRRVIIALNTISLSCPTQVEDWWLEVGYLSADTPLVPGTNFGGSWLGPKHPLRPLVGKNCLLAIYY